MTDAQDIRLDRPRNAVWRRPAPPARPGAGLDLRHLVVLREIARQGTFAAAASALSFTPSAVSQQMAKLERDVGAQLFDRRPRGTLLTEAGGALLGHAEALLGRLADAELDLWRIAHGSAGHLRLGSFPTATASFGARALAAFRGAFPELTLQLVDGEPHESVARLKAHELDLAVVFELDDWPASRDYAGRTVCAQPELACVDLLEDPFRLVMPSGHPLAALSIVRPDDLAGHRIVGCPDGCPPWGAGLTAACSAAGVELEFDDCYQTLDFRAMQALVASGAGLSLVPALALDPMLAGLCARPLVGAPVRHVRLARLADASPSAPCAALLQIVLDVLAARTVAGERPVLPGDVLAGDQAVA